ncbi:FadR/GntR family transcriptional regulator [Paracoccus sp. (in: a-proteobacteria)]|uniref:FadR/GntR family transcriptional regulator n=1 Tax=Paracoccus sp. TaxID=267 RepID=UPI002B003141|nr:FCD domain-containing protein [Paracoccus sp. (in: a-proteobacteria)]
MQPRIVSQPVTKSEQIARLLLNRIVDSGARPGTSLGTEAELLQQFGVSRPTLRESLRILEAQGVLELRPGPKGGILVAETRIEVLAHTLSVLLRLNGISFGAILRARFAIEPVLARGAAVNGTEENFRAMDETIERLEAAGDDVQAIYRENRAFHNLIASAARNPVLEVFWSSIRILASGEGAGLRYSERNRRGIIAAHKQIVAALRARDADKAESLILEHLGELKELLRRRHLDQLDQPAQITFPGGSPI